MAYTNTNAENVKLGTCSVTFDATDLGLTKGGVEVALTVETYKVTVDQFGQTEINDYILGRKAMVTVPLAETDLTIFQAIVPGSTLITDGTTPTKKKLVVNSSVGINLRSLAGKLVLHPVALAAGDKNDDFVLPICSPKGEFTFAYKLDEERIYNVEFYGYPDLATGLLYVIGDESATA